MKKLLTVMLAAMLAAGVAGAQTYINLGCAQPTGIIKSDADIVQSKLMKSIAWFGGLSHNFALSKSLGVEAGVDFLYELKDDEEGLLGRNAGVKHEYMALRFPVLFNHTAQATGDVKFKFLLGPTAYYGLKKVSYPYYLDKVSYVTDYYKDGLYDRLSLAASAAVAAEWAGKVRLKVGFDYGLLDVDKSDISSFTENMLSITLGYIF